MNLHTTEYLPKGDPLGSIVLVHGMGEHSGRYSHVVEYLVNLGYAVVTGDLPGFGRSSGHRGHADGFGEYFNAVAGWLTRAKAVCDGPVFLMGHSLGGLISYRYAQDGAAWGKQEIAGLILSAPSMRLRVKVPVWKSSLAKLVDRAFPTLAMANGVRSRDLTRDPDIAGRYLTDPLNYPKVTARWFSTLNKEMAAAISMDIPAIPTLLLLGGSDPLVDVDFLKDHFESPNVRSIMYEGYLHEILNEVGREKVMEDIAGWLGIHIWE